VESVVERGRYSHAVVYESVYEYGLNLLLYAPLQDA
jgi:hypothetical protein